MLEKLQEQSTGKKYVLPSIIGTIFGIQIFEISGSRNLNFCVFRDIYSHIFEFLSTKNFITDSKHSSDFQRTFKVSTSAMFALKNRQILIKNVKAKL